MHQYMDDILMGVIIIGCIVLLALGIDGEVKSILIMAGSYFFYTRVGSKIGKGGGGG